MKLFRFIQSFFIILISFFYNSHSYGFELIEKTETVNIEQQTNRFPTVSLLNPSLKIVSCSTTSTDGSLSLVSSQKNYQTDYDTPFVVDDDSNDSDVYSTISEAIENALDGSTILVCDGYYELGEDIEIEKSLQIIGLGEPENVTIDGNRSDNMFDLYDAIITIENINFKNGLANNGGAVYADNVELTINNCIFEENEASQNGGAVYVTNSNGVEITDSTFEGNSAHYGGAIYVRESDNLMILENTLSDNEALYDGGGIRLYQADDILLYDNTIENNSAEYGGGIAFSHSDNITVMLNSIESNNADQTGGGFYAYYGETYDITMNTISENKAAAGGGIAFTYTDLVEISLNTIEENTAQGCSAIRINGGNDVTVSASNTISNNTDTYDEVDWDCGY